jgi:hypothetical protein
MTIRRPATADEEIIGRSLVSFAKKRINGLPDKDPAQAAYVNRLSYRARNLSNAAGWLFRSCVRAD